MGGDLRVFFRGEHADRTSLGPPSRRRASPAMAPRSAARALPRSPVRRPCRFLPILLQKSLMFSGNSDSVSVTRFAMEASDDGAAQSRSRTVVLFIST